MQRIRFPVLLACCAAGLVACTGSGPAADPPVCTPWLPVDVIGAADAGNPYASIDAGEPVCIGDPPPCYLLTPGLECVQIAGCHEEDECTGTALGYPCQMVAHDPLVCARTAGCTWDFEAGECRGRRLPCSTLNAEWSCRVNYGCTWHTRCVGTPFPCELLPEDVCTMQDGCNLAPDVGP